jgi:hypothetical protein
MSLRDVTPRRALTLPQRAAFSLPPARGKGRGWGASVARPSPEGEKLGEKGRNGGIYDCPEWTPQQQRTERRIDGGFPFLRLLRLRAQRPGDPNQAPDCLALHFSIAKTEIPRKDVYSIRNHG